MADESNTEIVETAPASEVAPPKKRRGPRPKNVVEDATAEPPAAAQPARGRKKRADKSADGNLSVAAPAVAKTKATKAAKVAAKTRGAKQPTAATPVLDGIADLLQLEEENARLRKTLAEKLRAENAELRKRLGH
ncbi:hypothetical protein N182_35120 [Sinorhizobium sp. GL2]|nr:hypothetical protein N182_35120 [Sinorhizobium sp. GL2]